MPKSVDHDARRREIAAAVARIASERGLQRVTFREVAIEAGVSVALIQHYFGSKESLLFRTLEIQSEYMARRIAERLGELASSDNPMERLRTIASAFIPTDDESRSAMLLYHAFAGAALTDAKLRHAEGFRNAESLAETMASELERARSLGYLMSDFDSATEAWTILTLVLGLSLSCLLEQVTPDDAFDVLESHLRRL